MAKARSPEYPAIGLKEAIDRVTLVYEKDYQNKLPKNVIAAHMGYKSLSGASLPILAALGKFGLLEGRGDETRVSDRALAIIAHAPGSKERMVALKEAASSPELFAELDSKFPNGKASDAAIRSYLLTEKFIPSAADTAIRSYRETKEVVDAEIALYNPDKANSGEKSARPLPAVEVGDLVQVEIAGAFQLERPARVRAIQDYEGQKWAFIEGSDTGIPMEQVIVQTTPPPGADPPRLPPEELGQREEKFALKEGDVIIRFPAGLSADSVEDLDDYIQVLLKKARREAGMPKKDVAK